MIFAKIKTLQKVSYWIIILNLIHLKKLTPIQFKRFKKEREKEALIKKIGLQAYLKTIN